MALAAEEVREREQFVLLDDQQVVRPGEMGTVAEIQATATDKGLACRVVPLDSQFRCDGSDAYVRWVVRLLGLEPEGLSPGIPTA